MPSPPAITSFLLRLDQLIGPGTAIEGIVTVSTVQRIRSRIAMQIVSSVAAQQMVIAVAPGNCIVAAAPDQQIGPGTTI